jgi:hypothetical protein
MKRILHFILLFFVFESYSIGQTDIIKSIPIDEFASPLPKIVGDSLLFNIYVKNNKIWASTLNNLELIQNPEQLETYYCKVVKQISKGYLCYYCNEYYISLSIDSLTPYILVDHILEKLKSLSQQEIYLRLNNLEDQNSGLKMNLLLNTINRQKIAASLYGKSYSNVKDLKGECAIYISPKSVPPQPPIPQPEKDYLDEYSELNKKGIATNYYLIERKNGALFINMQESNILKLSEIISDSNSKLLIEVNASNTYNDLIKLLEDLYRVQSIVLQNKSWELFDKDIRELNSKEYWKVRDLVQLHYYILSLSDQQYIKSN